VRASFLAAGARSRPAKEKTTEKPEHKENPRRHGQRNQREKDPWSKSNISTGRGVRNQKARQPGPKKALKPGEEENGHKTTFPLEKRKFVGTGEKARYEGENDRNPLFTVRQRIPRPARKRILLPGIRVIRQGSNAGSLELVLEGPKSSANLIRDRFLSRRSLRGDLHGKGDFRGLKKRGTRAQ